MSILKKISIWLLGVFFTFCILAAAVLAATNTVFGKPDNLKQSLSDSKVYDGTAAGLVDQAIKNTQKPEQKGANQQQEEGISLDEQTTRQIADRVITPQRVQIYAEQIIDGTYNWLEGESKQPDFVIDLSGIKKDLSSAVGDAAAKRVQGLPECTLAQLQKLNLNEINPFDLPCRPPGINIQAERAKIVKEINKNEGLLGEDTALTADEIGKDKETGKNLFENMAAIPAIFQWSKSGSWILGALALASAAGIILWSEDRNKGYKKVSVRVLIAGILLLISIGLTVLAFNIVDPASKADATAMETAMFDLVTSLNAAYNRALSVYAIAYTLLGIAGLIWLKHNTPKTTAATSKSKK